ncbi:terminase large subunit domain-containing protein [Microbulbifer sp. THAF38]|uniref:terminase large subunit domain-containing protein n=1 Tax=Microbulbifer sp. THAF38 TaxID=2587856 RepID=UPI0012AA36B1|nr:terminase family protein [Microbulbifer sp. THAF38]QFT55585.1 Terminase-like family protein [Microbulbifer sp. THAF38]
MTPAETIRLAQALQTVKEHKKYNKRHYFKPYDWQLQWYGAFQAHKQCLLMAANRVGKTASEAYQVASHLIGEYPDWWPGITFNYAPYTWGLGVTGEQIRDVMQKELFGNYYGGQFDGTGLVHKDLIHEVVPAMGTPRLAKDIYVRHGAGGDVVNYSQISLKAYAQGQHVLMGASVDYGWIDEEPKDSEIYPQTLTRTATGNRNKGGWASLTFTPENGMTDLVTQFMEDRQKGQYLQTVTWDDAPHLDDSTKEQLLAAFPPYQRDMRTKGIPLLGEGMVYPVSEDSIKIDPIELPPHWKKCAAIDFGFSHDTAVCWTAYDADADIIYVFDGYAKSGEVPAIHAAAINSRGDYIPVIYPHDGDSVEKGSGQTMADQYRQLNVNMHIKFTNEDGTNFVEPGIQELYQRMCTGRLKVFSTVKPFWDEFRKYHRKNGRIVKIDDDFMDGFRYSALSVARFGETRSGADNFDYSRSNPGIRY